MIEDNAGPGSTVGGDKNYDTADFVDAHTTRHAGYRITTIKLKRIEEPFGCTKREPDTVFANLRQIRVGELLIGIDASSPAGASSLAN